MTIYSFGQHTVRKHVVSITQKSWHVLKFCYHWLKTCCRLVTHYSASESENQKKLVLNTQNQGAKHENHVIY